MIYFNDGKVRKGIVKNEDDKSVEIDIGAGTVAFSKNNITKIERSGPEELQAINQEWQEKQKNINKEKDVSERERKLRFAEYDKWTSKTDGKNGDALKGGEIPIVTDPNSKGVMVKALIDGKADTMLEIDSGADVVVLSRKAGEAIGIDLSGTNELVELRLAGDRRAKAKMTVLKSVKLNDVELKGVRAAVLLDNESGLMLADGLLGMSFLDKFNFKIDRKNMKLVLEKI